MKPKDIASFKPPQKAQAGKGSKPRQGQSLAAYQVNYDDIFRKPKPAKG